MHILTFCPRGATPGFAFTFSSTLIRKFTLLPLHAKGLSLRDKVSFGNLILQIGYTSGVSSYTEGVTDL